MATRIAVARYLPNGDLDDSFGDRGISILRFDEGFKSRTMAVRIGRDDGVVVCCEVENQLGLGRLRADGAPDNSFGVNGRVVVPFMAGLDSPAVRSALFAQSQLAFASEVAPISTGGSEAAALSASPRVIVVGRVGGSDDQQLAAVAQYSPEGRPDRTFSSDGKAMIGFQSNRFEVVAAAFSARQGRIFVVAEGLGDLLPTVHVGCLLLSGGPDESFGNGGRLSTVFVAPGRGGGTSIVKPADAVIQPGAITLAGSATNADRGPLSFVVAHLNDEGRDRSFGEEGLAFARFETTDSFANSVIVDGRSRVVAAGCAGNNFALARFLRSGWLDEQFGQGGRLATNFDKGRAIAHVVKLESPVSERLVAAGGTGLRFFALARYLNDGSLDSAFGVDGRVSTDVAGEGSVTEVRDFAFDSQDRIVAVGPVFQQVA